MTVPNQLLAHFQCSCERRRACTFRERMRLFDKRMSARRISSSDHENEIIKQLPQMR